MKKQKWGAIAKKTMVFLTSCTLMVGGLSYAPAVFYSDPAAITVEALTCNAPSPIAWQQDSTSRAQIDSYLTGVSYWNNHLWTSIGSRNQTIGSSACGLFSVINSVFYKTGNFMDPTFVADWSKANGYRTANNGVDTRFFKAYSQNYGSTYGFSYAGSYSSVSSALEHVRNGGTICGCVPGHWIAIVDYNASTGKYLMLDSSRASSRCGSIGGWSGERGVAWVSGSIFSSGKYTLSGRCMYGLSYSGSRPTPVPDTNTASDSQLPWNYTYPTRTLYQKSPMMNGNDVRWLQSALSYLGYACTVDGYLGAETKNQIRAYQSANGLSVDGKAGTKTLSSLKAKAEAKNNGSSDGQTSNNSNYGTPSRTLRYTKGSLMRGDDVKWLQASLNQLINAGLTVDGMFGKNTYNAVKNFQSLNSLGVDGIVGTYTRGKLTALLENKDYVPPQSSTGTILRYGYSEPSGNLKSGSKGDTVRWLQVALNNTMSSGLDIDGHYGPKTKAAVQSFQSQNGLKADGIFGNASRAKMKELLAARSITICGGSEEPTIAELQLAEQKYYFAEEESIAFEFDSDTADTYHLVIRNEENGEVVYDYQTDEYSLTTALNAGTYTATVTVSNDKGSLTSDPISFAVIQQSEKDEAISQIRSSAYDTALSYDLKTDTLYMTADATYESMWRFVSHENWTFEIYNAYYGKMLTISDGKLKMVDPNPEDANAYWYLYEEDGMSFIKNMTSDQTITISSDGEISLEALDTISDAQSVSFVTDNKNTVVPTFTQIDATHAKLSWNPVEGCDLYTVTIFDTDGVTEDGIFDYIETTDVSCEIEIPENAAYSVYLEASVAGDTIIGIGVGEDDETPEQPEQPPQEEPVDPSEQYLTKVIQLQRYLLNESGYSVSELNELDMDFDGTLTALDLVLLKKMILSD